MAKATARTGMNAAVRTACDDMREMIKQEKNEIKRLKRLIDSKTAELRKLQGQKPPDKAAIQALKNMIAALRKDLASRQEGLTGLEQVVSENC